MNDNTKLYSILAYIGILFLVGMIADPQNPRVKFHVNQGLILFICSIILGIGSMIVGIILAFIPVIGPILSLLIGLAIWAFIIGFAIIGIINVTKDEDKRLPVIGKFDIIK